MTEQYEQITDWDEFIAAHKEGTLYTKLRSGEHYRCEDVDRLDLVDLNNFIRRGSYYRKVEPEEVEFIEIGNRNGRRFYVESPSILPFVVPDEWNPTGYIIKGVRVKA